MAEATLYRLANPKFFARAEEDVEMMCDAILAKAAPHLPHGRADKHGRAFRGVASVQFAWSGSP